MASTFGGIKQLFNAQAASQASQMAEQLSANAIRELDDAELLQVAGGSTSPLL